ncbi:hypothetical protein, partial [Microbulbifer halophilus]|uniref:hypothetical protein n=1 Tax=Microbulbifer halophilus TaxID=453963 RepID=UPI00363AA767
MATATTLREFRIPLAEIAQIPAAENATVRYLECHGDLAHLGLEYAGVSPLGKGGTEAAAAAGGPA